MKELKKSQKEKLAKADPTRIQIWYRLREELNKFIDEHKDIAEAAKRLGVKWTSLRSYIYITDYPRLPTVETFVKWEIRGFIDVKYVLFGERKNQEFLIVKNKVGELKGEIEKLKKTKKLN